MPPVSILVCSMSLINSVYGHNLVEGMCFATINLSTAALLDAHGMLPGLYCSLEGVKE